jgi:hypothetical protein
MNADEFEKGFQQTSQSLLVWGDGHRNAVRVLAGLLLGLIIGFILFH